MVTRIIWLVVSSGRVMTIQFGEKRQVNMLVSVTH